MMMLTSTPDNSPSLSVIEGGLTLIAVAIVFVFPNLGSRFFASIERLFRPLAHRKALAAVFVGCAQLVLRLAILPLIPVPKPFVPDDFSFLLAAKTFALGRLANPTPAMWQHFETVHVSMTPTYMSMYFPAQGLILAAGQVLFGSPWIAILLTTALMCAAICWMLQAWLPPTWALLGGLIAVLHLGLFSYWVNTYTGAGQLAALGGALALGALPRLKKHLQLRYGLLLAAGFALLVIARPYEGMLLGIPVAVAVVRWCLFGINRPSPALLARHAAVPVALLAATIAWMGFYDSRAFGNPLTAPYAINRAQYAVSPYYVWQHQRPDPGYRHAVLRDFYYNNELPMYRKIHNPVRFVPLTIAKLALGLLFFAGVSLLPPLIMVRRVLLDKRTRLLVVAVAILCAGMAIEIYLIPHYLAPFTAAFYAIGLQAMRHLRVWRPGNKPAGLAMLRLCVAVTVLMGGVRLFAEPMHFKIIDFPAGDWNFSWYGPGSQFGAQRANIQAQLDRSPGQQLVLVRYGAKHELLNEWVYNDPDIDRSKVIWAREMDAASNQDLIRHYSDRTVWLVQPDTGPATLEPYPDSARADFVARSDAR
jgi:hypothetical protein